jgi:hypothetical protein
MMEHISAHLGTTVDSSQFSRTIQLIKAAGMTVTVATTKQSFRRKSRAKI